MSINLEYFRVFYHVATQRNISKAAQAMFLSQPTVSNQLHALEKQVGYSLFYRLPRGVELTPEGSFLFNEIAPAMERMLAAEKRAEEYRNGNEGTIHISYNSNSTEQNFSSFVNQFKKQYPGINIMAGRMPRWSLKNALNSGVVDLAIAARPYSLTPLYDSDFPTPKTVSTTPGEISEYLLHTFSETIIAGKNYESLRGKTHYATELGKYPIIMQTKQELKVKTEYVTQYYLDLFQQAPEIQHKNIAVTDIDSITNLIRGNFGLGIVPSFIADIILQEEPNEFVPVKIHEKMMSYQFILHYSESRRPPLVAFKFIDFLLNNSAFSPIKIECSI